MIVVDASVVIDVLVGEGRSVERLALEELAAPHLLDAEVGSAMRRVTRLGRLGAVAAGRALSDYLELEIVRYGHTALLPRAWELRSNLTVYDALYVALAEVLKAPLLTLDSRMAGAPGLRAVIEVAPV